MVSVPLILSAAATIRRAPPRYHRGAILSDCRIDLQVLAAMRHTKIVFTMMMFLFEEPRGNCGNIQAGVSRLFDPHCHAQAQIIGLQSIGNSDLAGATLRFLTADGLKKNVGLVPTRIGDIV